MKKPGTKVIVLKLAGQVAGKDMVFRGHTFVKGVLVLCCNANRLAAIQNCFRGRLPIEDPEVFDNSTEGLEAYKKYCLEAERPLDTNAVHDLGKTKGQVDLNPEPEVPEVDPLDAELDDILADSKADAVDVVEDSDTDSESTDSEADDVVDPAVARENGVRAALGQLDHSNDDHWTSTGLPKMDVIEGIMGDESVTRKEVNAIAPDLRRAQ